MTTSRPKVVLAAVAAVATFGGLTAAPATAADTPNAATLRGAPAAADAAQPASAANGAAGIGKSRTKAPKATRGIDKTVRKGTPAQAVKAHLTAFKDTYKVNASDFQAVSTNTKADGSSTVRLQQTYAGLPVFGAQYVVQTNSSAAGQQVESTTGTVFSDLSGSMKPKVSEARAKQRLHLHRTVSSVASPKIESKGLVVLPVGSGAPAWNFVVSGTSDRGEPVRQQVFVDARVGGIALSYTMIHAAEAGSGEAAEASGTTFKGAPVTLQVTKTPEGRFELRDQSRAMHSKRGGEILTYDALGRDYTLYSSAMPEDTPIYSSATNEFDATATKTGAVDAHVNAGKVYEFLRTHLDRNGVDGKGGTMKSVVNVTSNGKEYGNAFWDGTKMVYGSSKGVPFSSTLDVVGHEMSHGVTEHGANLLYINQSGALNEAISDYFGNAIEVDDLGIGMDDPTAGLIGEYLCTDKAPADCALRDLNDGRVAGKDYILLSVDYDNGGVHVNSTIVGGALWDIREQLGGDIADKLVYAAQTDYLTPMSNFSDMRTAMEYAAKRSRLSPDQQAVVSAAFEKHGIYAGWEEKTQTNDANILAKDIVSTYEGWGPADDTAAVVDGDKWAASLLDIEGFFAGENDFRIIVGEFSKPGKTRTIHNGGAWDLNPAMDNGRLIFTRIKADSVDIVEQRGNGVGGVKVLAGGPGDQTRPSISGDTVAWLDTRDDETDVWVKVGSAQPRNLTPAAGTKATEVVVKGDILAWSTSSTVNTVHLTDGRTATAKITGSLFNSVTDLQLNKNGLFFRSSGLGDSVYFAEPFALTAMKKLNFGKNLYAAQFTVNDEWIAYDSTTAWAALTYPRNDETHKLRIAKVDDLIAGKATWDRVACATGAQISPQLGDGQRLVWLDTSYARTDIVTRATPVGGTC